MMYVFALLSIVVFYLGFRCSETIVNPLSAFSGVWLAMGLLYQLRLSGLQEALHEELYLALIIVLLAFSVSWFVIDFGISALIKHRSSGVIKNNAIVTSASIEHIAYMCFLLFIAWFVASIAEVYISRGVPAYWLLTGLEKTYFDFGVPSVHGFLNAMGILIATVTAYLLMKKCPYKKSLLVILAVEAVYYLMIISRQVIMSAAIQIFIVYLIVNRGSIPLVRLCLVALAGVFAFGVIGNIRTGYETFMHVAQLPDGLPSWAAGFYWVYMYLAMTLANLNNLVMQAFEPLGASYLFQDFIPSVVSQALDLPQVDSLSYLVSIQFNVSGFFAHYFEAFGWQGLVVAGAVFGCVSGTASSWFRFRPSVVSLLFFVIVMQIVLLSFFTDLLLYLPVSFQLVLLFAFSTPACSLFDCFGWARRELKTEE